MQSSQQSRIYFSAKEPAWTIFIYKKTFARSTVGCSINSQLVFYADNYNIYIALIVMNEYLHYPYFIAAIKQRISISQHWLAICPKKYVHAKSKEIQLRWRN